MRQKRNQKNTREKTRKQKKWEDNAEERTRGSTIDWAENGGAVTGARSPILR